VRAHQLSSSIVFSAVLLLGLFGMTARTATDSDLWWHLRTGQWIVETGHVPHSDLFSFTRGGSPWVSHEWLSEVILFELWRQGGAALLIVFSAIVTTAGFLLLYLRCPGKPHWAAAATALGACAAAPFWGSRPQMFTFTLASLLLWLVERGEQQPRLLLWIPPLFLLWLNLHAGFALGPALLLLYAIGVTFEAVAGTTPWPQARLPILRVLMITLASLALVPLNPSGGQLYRYPFDTLRSHGMRSLIVEWSSPNFHRWLHVALLVVFLLLFTALAVSRSPLKGRALLPLLFTSFAALDAVRHIPIFILLAIPVIAAALPASKPSAILSPSPPPRSRPRAFFNAAALILLGAFTLWTWVDLARQQETQEAALFPESAVAFLRASPQPERLFVYYDWGGYAIWKLYPQYRVFADGRADLYGDDLLQQCIQTVVQLRQGWQAVLDRWNVQTILVPPGTALAQALFLDPHWSIPYRDPRSVVFVRIEPPGGHPQFHPENALKPKKCILKPSRICETRAMLGIGFISSPGL